MENNQYPKFQWSVFVKNGKDCQYVVRANTIEEFVQLKNQVLAEVAKDLIASGANIQQHVPSAAVISAPVQPVNASAEKCVMHDVTMKERVMKNGGHFYDHRKKEGESWFACKGQGWVAS